MLPMPNGYKNPDPTPAQAQKSKTFAGGTVLASILGHETKPLTSKPGGDLPYNTPEDSVQVPFHTPCKSLL